MNLNKLAIVFVALFSLNSVAADLKVGDLAPVFSLKLQDGKDFELKNRQGKWTVLYFYPKAETPGCTKQACAFRDNIEKIHVLGAEVFGISVNSVDDQKKFKEHHKLNFDLLADEAGAVTNLFGSKMPVMRMSKRWTYIIDPSLKIRSIDKDVDPVKDADHVALKLTELQKK